MKRKIFFLILNLILLLLFTAFDNPDDQIVNIFQNDTDTSYIEALNDPYKLSINDSELLADAIYAETINDPYIKEALSTIDYRLSQIADNTLAKIIPQYTMYDEYKTDLLPMVRSRLLSGSSIDKPAQLLSVSKTSFVLSKDKIKSFEYGTSDNFHAEVCFLNAGTMTWNADYYCKIGEKDNENFAFINNETSPGSWGCCEFDTFYENYSIGQKSQSISLYNNYGTLVPDSQTKIYWQVIEGISKPNLHMLIPTPMPIYRVGNSTFTVYEIGNPDNHDDFVPTTNLYFEICYKNVGTYAWNENFSCKITSNNGYNIQPKDDFVKLGKIVLPDEWGCFSYNGVGGTGYTLRSYCPGFQLYTDKGDEVMNGFLSQCFTIH